MSTSPEGIRKPCTKSQVNGAAFSRNNSPLLHSHEIIYAAIKGNSENSRMRVCARKYADHQRKKRHCCDIKLHEQRRLIIQGVENHLQHKW